MYAKKQGNNADFYFATVKNAFEFRYFVAGARVTCFGCNPTLTSFNYV
jgi:hypothetical protein